MGNSTSFLSTKPYRENGDSYFIN